MVDQLKQIKHIVQVMSENRSFDQLLGFLYTEADNVSPAGHDYEGLTGKESNPDDTGREIQVFEIEANSAHPYLMPGADPGEGFQNTNPPFSEYEVAPDAVPTNKGFVINFKAAIAADETKNYKDTLPGTDPSEVSPRIKAGTVFRAAAGDGEHQDPHLERVTPREVRPVQAREDPCQEALAAANPQRPGRVRPYTSGHVVACGGR